MQVAGTAKNPIGVVICEMRLCIQPSLYRGGQRVGEQKGAGVTIVSPPEIKAQGIAAGGDLFGDPGMHKLDFAGFLLDRIARIRAWQLTSSASCGGAIRTFVTSSKQLLPGLASSRMRPRGMAVARYSIIHVGTFADRGPLWTEQAAHRTVDPMPYRV